MLTHFQQHDTIRTKQNFFQDNNLRTAAHCGAAKGQMRMLKLLRQYNASFEIQNYRGDLPIHEAVQVDCKGTSGHPAHWLLDLLDVVEWLLALHPDTINAASHEGRTCLHLAAAKGSIEMVVLLCTKGCFTDPLMLHDVRFRFLTRSFFLSGQFVYSPGPGWKEKAPGGRWLLEVKKSSALFWSRRGNKEKQPDDVWRKNGCRWQRSLESSEERISAQLDKVALSVLNEPNKPEKAPKDTKSTAVNTSVRIYQTPKKC